MTIAQARNARVGGRLALWLVAVVFGVRMAEAQPAGFHDLSPKERADWFEDVGGAVHDAQPPSETPEAPSSMPAGPWKQVRDSIKWRVDDSGFVVFDDGQRPMGSRIFARSCFLQYGDSFRRWATVYSRGLGVAHLVATAITESGCSELSGLGSIDGKSTGLMQVTGSTCTTLLPVAGRGRMTAAACLEKMAADPDFSIELAAAYITQPKQLEMTSLDPPKVAAAYNAGGLYFDSQNPWRLRVTGNHIDRFVSAYNAYMGWQSDEAAGRSTRSPAVRLTRGATLPRVVESLAALQELTAGAKAGDTVFVGDWKTRRGDFYVLVNGEWRASLEDSEK
jgi:hypothetical protein